MKFLFDIYRNATTFFRAVTSKYIVTFDAISLSVVDFFSQVSDKTKMSVSDELAQIFHAIANRLKDGLEQIISDTQSGFPDLFGFIRS